MQWLSHDIWHSDASMKLAKGRQGRADFRFAVNITAQREGERATTLCTAE